MYIIYLFLNVYISRMEDIFPDMPPAIPTHDVSRYPRTAFVSNLDYEVKESTIREIFQEVKYIFAQQYNSYR